MPTGEATHFVDVEPDEEFVYAVVIQRPFADECDAGDPARCWHNGTTEDAVTEMERDLLDRLPAHWRVKVLERGYVEPTVPEFTRRLGTLVGWARSERATAVHFRKLMFTARKLKAMIEQDVGKSDGEIVGRPLSKRQRKAAEKALRAAREVLGL